MRDKVGSVSDELPVSEAARASTLGIHSEAESALMALGYKPQEASILVKQHAKEDMSVEQIVRICLQNKGQ